MNEVDALKKELMDFKAEINKQLSGVRTDLKELTKALRDLIRLEGNIAQLSDLVGRHATESRDHEKRIRKIEMQLAGTSKSVTLFDQIVRHTVLLVVGGVFSVLIIKAAGG